MDKRAFLYKSLLQTLDEEMQYHERLLELIHEETLVLRKSFLPEILDISTRKGEAYRQSEAAAAQQRVAENCN